MYLKIKKKKKKRNKSDEKRINDLNDIFFVFISRFFFNFLSFTVAGQKDSEWVRERERKVTRESVDKQNNILKKKTEKNSNARLHDVKHDLCKNLGTRWNADSDSDYYYERIHTVLYVYKWREKNPKNKATMNSIYCKMRQDEAFFFVLLEATRHKSVIPIAMGCIEFLLTLFFLCVIDRDRTFADQDDSNYIDVYY